jgi:hypothetical protein
MSFEKLKLPLQYNFPLDLSSPVDILFTEMLVFIITWQTLLTRGVDWQVTVGNELEALRAVIHVIHAVTFLGSSAGGGERSSLRLSPSSHGIGRGVNHKKCRNAGSKKYLPLQGFLTGGYNR